MANISNINNILRTGSLGIGVNRDPLSVLEVSSASKAGIKMFNTTGTTGLTYQLYSDPSGNFLIFNVSSDRNDLIINNSGNATFGGDVRLGDDKRLILGASTDGTIQYDGTNDELEIKTSADASEISLIAGSSNTYTSEIQIGARSSSQGEGIFFKTRSVERMRITSTGEANFVKNVNTQLNFHATGGTPSLRLTDSFGSGGQLADFAIEVYNGDFEIKDKKNSNLSRFRIANNGSIFALGLGGTAASNSDVRYSTANGELYYQQSSKRYKTNIVNLENSLDKINSLRPVRYNDIKTNEPACGLIAEETVEIIPEVVFNKKIEGFDGPQIEGINYTDLVPYLIKSIQELEAKIKILENKPCNCNCK